MRRSSSSILLLLMLLVLATLPVSSIAVAAQAGADKGLVVFARKKTMKGKAIRFNLEQDGRPIGQLLSGTRRTTEGIRLGL